MKTKNKTWLSNHSHVWIVIILGTVLAIIFINWLPRQKVFSSILIGLVVTHSLIFLVATFVGWLLLPEKIISKFGKKNPVAVYDFGWSSRWIKGFGYASFIIALLAFYSYFALTGNPFYQLLSFTLLLLLAVNLFIGNIIARTSKSMESNILPYTDLFKGGKDKVLDAGCGSGRTTIALLRAVPDINIISFDRFDANYIDNGGQTLLKQNIELAGISSRVKIELGDITSTPFKNNYFNAAISSYMFDHLGENKLVALKEIRRILKPGGRFLLIIFVRGYTTFAIANILSLAIATRNEWKQLFEQSGMSLIDEGIINFGTYFLIEKPK